MIGNDSLVKAIRTLNFTFKRQADRVCIYKQRGTTLRVSIRRNSEHTEEYACEVLRQAGMTRDKIAEFIRDAKH